MDNTEQREGKFATLHTPYLGYYRIQIICRSGYKWLVEICGSGVQEEFYEDEFEIEEE